MESTGKRPIQPEHPTLSSSLLDGVQQMNADSWSRLVTTFGPIVYGWCRASGIGESDSPDVVQNVFASVASGICSFQREKDKGSFRSWLATISRNKVRDYFRKRISLKLRPAGPPLGNACRKSQTNWSRRSALKVREVASITKSLSRFEVNSNR